RLQDVLNGMALTPKLLRVTGNYGRGTRRRVRLWQTQVVGEPAGSEFATGSFPGVRQARKIFEGTGNAVVDDTQ
ncbi:MAG TPA: hypothetical protein VLI04_16290, partial [Nocardioidaceae bacterium]|nr:hypothetical protein [Nocardioidaceae bacterium]